MGKFAARLHVILARNGRIGIIIRRGPSKSVCTILWERKTDTFKLGQWLRGRIYERRSDLSPDGKHFIYFAMNGKWESETKGAWTAISKAPYLKAVSLFAKGDCWNGGGLFTTANNIWLNDGYGHTTLKEFSKFQRDLGFKPTYHHGECLGVYYPRLIRDGWTCRKHESDEVDIFEKDLSGGWILRKTAHAQVGAPEGKGCYWDEHELEHSDSATLLKFPDWEWADLDKNRLVWTTRGQLWAGFVKGAGIQNQKCLHDFNDMKFEPITAPY